MALPQAPAIADQYREAVVHELSQPVTALQGSIEVALLRGQSGLEYRQALELALLQANRLAAILDHLRDHPQSY